jgi:hypothetical protein
MPRIVCPCCRKKINPPDRLIGRRVMCPRCDTPIVVPTELVEAVEEAAAKEPTSPREDLPFPLAARLGIAAMVLGTISIAIMCLPYTFYLSIGLSSVGLLLGLVGVYYAWTDGQPLPPAIAESVGIWGGFGTRIRDYLLGGIGICLFALVLTLLPLLLQGLSEQ